MGFEDEKAGDVSNKVDQSAVTSKQETKESFTFEWTLENFQELPLTIYSPKFKESPNSLYEWELKVSTQETVKDVDFVGIYLYLSESSIINEPVKADYQLSIVDSNRKVLRALCSKDKQFVPGGNGFGSKMFKRSTLLNPLKGFLVQGHIFKLQCEISIKNIIRHGIIKRPLENDHGERISKKVKFSDVTVKTKSSSFPSSTVLLAAHSPIFESILMSGQDENNSSSMDKIIHIDGDFSDEAVKIMLDFVHGHSSDLLNKHLVELLKLCDKYQLAQLEEKCEEIIQNNCD